jgi:CarboxypepD_reg-like domain
MRAILTLTILTFSMMGYTQSSQILKGSVSDEFDKPVKNAKVSIGGFGNSILTDSKGIFTIEIVRSNQLLQITYAGYKTISRKISIVKSDPKDTLKIYFKLEPSVNELEAVDISFKKVERVHEEASNILDFDFYEDKILLLVNKGKQYKLQLITRNDSTLAEFKLEIKPIEFYSDCYKNLHIKTADSVFQIYWNIDGLQLMTGISSQESIQVLEPCISNTQNHLVFKTISEYKQTCIYYSINKIDRKPAIIHIATDIDAERYRENFYRSNLAESAFAKHVMGDNTHLEQRFARDVQSSGMFFEKILNAENYNPLFNVNDTILVVDHIRDTLFAYLSNGTGLSKKFISHHRQSGWDKLLLIDTKTKNIYAKFVVDGIVYLKKLNQETGSLEGNSKIAEHIYPEKLKLNNDFAYYLSRRSNELGNNYLYRQKIR